MVYKTLL